MGAKVLFIDRIPRDEYPALFLLHMLLFAGSLSFAHRLAAAPTLVEAFWAARAGLASVVASETGILLQCCDAEAIPSSLRMWRHFQ
ncbi:MAG: hypothetical protein ACKOCD_11250 [Nitrospiraceae bacterium]